MAVVLARARRGLFRDLIPRLFDDVSRKAAGFGLRYSSLGVILTRRRVAVRLPDILTTECQSLIGMAERLNVPIILAWVW